MGFGAFDEADAPRVGFGLGTDDDLRGGDDVRLENVRASASGHARGPALHCTVEARHPKSPGLRCARTYVFGQGCVTTTINGFTKRLDDDSENQSQLREPPPRHRRGGRRRARGTLRRRGRRGPRRHVRRVRRVGRRLGPRDVDQRGRRRSFNRRRRETSICRYSGRPRRPIARRVGSRVRAGRPRGCDGPVERAGRPRRGRRRDGGTSGERR